LTRMLPNLRRTVFVGLLAFPYIPIVLGVVPGEGLLAGLWLAMAGVVAPAAAGALLPGGAGSARWFTRAVAAAALLNVTVAVTLKIAGIPPGPRVYAALLGFITVTTGAYGVSWGGHVAGPRREAATWVAGLVAMTLAAWAGTSLVPPLEDQDSEVQGTAWGLAHDLEPICLTNRSTLWFFAHPPLLHAMNAATITLGGDLETVRPPHDASVREQEKLPPEQRRRGLSAAVDALRGRAPRPDRGYVWFHEVYKPFLNNPALTATRAPNFALAGAVAVLLLAWVRRLGAPLLDAALVTAVYLTLPEIVVRSAYGGYYALTAATFLAGARLASGSVGGARSAYLAGVMAALANQKAVLLGAAVAGWRALRAISGRSAFGLRPALPLVFGLAVGTGAFWVYGLWTAPGEFIADHLLEHGFHRFAGSEALTRAGKTIYPSRAGLWLEFARHMGWIWTGLATVSLGGIAVAAARSLRRTHRPDPSVRPPADLRDATGILTLWVLLGALVFTATDWRQTKHLCLLVPALSVMIGWLAGRLGTGPRWVLRTALVAALAWNVVWIVRLARDFGALAISTVW